MKVEYMKKIITIIACLVFAFLIIFWYMKGTFSSDIKQIDDTVKSNEESKKTDAKTTNTKTVRDTRYVDVSRWITDESGWKHYTNVPCIPQQREIDVKVESVEAVGSMEDLAEELSYFSDDVVARLEKAFASNQSCFKIISEMRNMDSNDTKWGLTSGRLYTFDPAAGLYQPKQSLGSLAHRVLSEQGEISGDCLIPANSVIKVETISFIRTEAVERVERGEEKLFWCPNSSTVNVLFKDVDESEIDGSLYFIEVDNVK